MIDAKVRQYVRDLYKKIYQRTPTNEEEQEFARSEVFPILHGLYIKSKKLEALE
ncbi:hypothetical protein UFOVP389_41 [uncultured Caudovirales phage]|uniref:Uncharacterized protein n=1 Tax=uncultured Caudovirales phage TaxID=2100421 RepID=A0A6J7X705_9CAUD|nr:hypothetical protein UFOVP389_41 [uncultured Caudovirales phage]